MERPTWDEFWLTQALFYSTRGTCDRLRTGCVIVDEFNHLISSGYNGSLPGQPHCDDIGHLMIEGHCMRTLHGEENALLHAKANLMGCTLYSLYSPCLNCAKKVFSVGIKRIVYVKDFKNIHGKEIGLAFLNESAERSGIKIEKLDINFKYILQKKINILRGPGGIFYEN